MITTRELFKGITWDDIRRKYGNNASRLKEKCVYHQKAKKIMVSQNGEEGILDYIFSKIGFSNRVSIEFGAIDGVRLSNTYMFKQKYNFKRFLIEGNPNALNNTNGEDIIHELITADNINGILEKAGCPQDLDLLSIDMDGDDYWVWKSMTHRPRVVIIEFHSVLPNDMALAIKPTMSDVCSHKVSYPEKGKKTYSKVTKRTNRLNAYYGANLRAMFLLAESKGYKFCTTLSDNAIFVLAEEFPKLGINEIDLEECLRDYFLPSYYWYKFMHKIDREWLIIDE